MKHHLISHLVLAAALLGTAALSQACFPFSAVGGLFNWEASVLQPDAGQELWDYMAQQKLTELYQAIPQQADADQTAAFFRQARQNDVDVYLLVGDPSWGLDPQGTDLCAAVDRVAQWKQELGEDAPVGVMADLEPYLTDAWQQDPAGVMDCYLAGMRAAYAAAEEAGVTLIACISCYYDTWGFTGALQELIETACHGVAVMNYYRGSEAENLATEWAMASQAGKLLRTVYELQAPGRYGITEQNTYYGAGLSALRKNYRQLARSLNGDSRLGYALHHYQALRELLG